PPSTPRGSRSCQAPPRRIAVDESPSIGSNTEHSFVIRSSLFRTVGVSTSSAPFGRARPVDGTGAAGAPSDKEFMATLAKGLAVLSSFGEQRPEMTLSEAAEI